MYIEITLAVIIAYLFGSVSSAIIVCKLMGLPDPRLQGSRNPGGTNVLRIGGIKAATITILGDVFKGVIPVLLAKWYGLSSVGIALTAFAAFLGHLYPIFFGLQGGKGVATVAGVTLAMSWQVGSWVIATWLFVALVSRYSSVASLIAATSIPFYFWFFTHDIAYVSIAVLMVIFIIFRHRTNIARLLQGKENKIF